VAVAPGIGFGEHGDDYVRIALVENEQRIRQAARNIRRFFDTAGGTIHNVAPQLARTQETCHPGIRLELNGSNEHQAGAPTISRSMRAAQPFYEASCIAKGRFVADTSAG